jgi:hypothetical protein
MSATAFSKTSFFAVSQIKNPIGKSPLTLSKVSAGTTKKILSFARKKLRKSEKFGACRILNF